MADLFTAAAELGEAIAGVDADRALLAAVSAEMGCAEADAPSTARALAAARDEARSTLTAIRDALGCEPGGEVEAAQWLVMQSGVAADTLRGALEHIGAQPGDDAAESALRVASALRYWPKVEPGRVLTPADFGKGEAGVLRLAALLAEAPEGAVVRDPHGNVSQKVAGVHNGRPWLAWCRPGFSAVRGAERDIASLAPLTVVAWPGGAS